LMCWALTSRMSNWPSSRFQIGFQNTPVDSMATCVTPDRLSQSLNSSRAAVVVPKVRVCDRVLPPPSRRRTHATTVFLCTSRPAQAEYRVSIGCLRKRNGREDTASMSSLLCVLSQGEATVSGTRRCPGHT
jgi:hypothetical protein